MKHFKRTLLALALLSFVVQACGDSGGEKKDTTMSGFSPPSDTPVFDGSRTFAYLEQQVAFGPRVPNSPAHERCLEYFVRFFDSLGLPAELQRFELPGYKDERLALTNVIVHINPSISRRILLAAHWDSRPWADMEKDPDRALRPIPGANDGASGVAVLMHLAELMKATPPSIGVDLVLFDGEDYGREGDESMFLLGAKYYSASRGTATSEILFGVLLDLVGDRDAEFPREELSQHYAGDVQTMIWDEAARLGLDRFSARQHSAILDDHVPLNKVAGIKTVDIIDAALVGGDPSSARRQYWHTLGDTPEVCAPETLHDVGRLLVSIIYGFHSI